MSAFMLIVALAVVDTRPADAGDGVTAMAKLGRGICRLESLSDGVRAEGCADGGAWTIPAPPAVTTAVKGDAGSALRDASLDVLKQGQTVDVQVDDGTTLWLGASERRGCGLRPLGLIRYDWSRDTAHVFRGTDAGPCGFLVQALLLRGDTLWVATDLGVSRLRVASEDWDEWTHYALTTDGEALEETACGSLLAQVAEAAAAPGGEALGRLLAEFRPKFAKRGMRPALARVRRRN
jgi:hypothetical protein